MRWNQGRDVIDRMLAGSELQRVPASREHADRLMLQARKHLASADEISDDDPAGGYTLVSRLARPMRPPRLTGPAALRPAAGLAAPSTT